MQPTDENKLLELKQQLQRSFSTNPDDVKAVTNYMSDNEKTPGHGVLLLTLCARNADEVGLAAAIGFKNYVRRFWSTQPLSQLGPFCVPEAEKNQIREAVVGIMVRSPDIIQRQLCEAIFAISLIDYPAKWPSLMPSLIEELNSNDLLHVLGVFETINEMFKRYRYEFKCNELWEEIKYSLDLFTPSYFEVFKKLMALIKSPPISNPAVVARLLLCSIDIFISSISQDLYDHFDENLAFYMESFLFLLSYDYPHLGDKDPDENSTAYAMKTKICDAVTLMVNQYDEDFKPYLQQFAERVWMLLTSSTSKKSDSLICSGINFLSKVAVRQQYAEIFSNPEALKGICENVIIPNMILKDSDLEAYDDNPEEYIRKDIEHMDIDTPRRAASDLIQSLCLHLEPQVIAIFGQYVEALLQEYTKNTTINWKSKDLATFLMISLAKKGQTAKYGVTKTSELVDIVKFFETTLQPHMVEENVDNLPILKTDAMKYLAEFRYRLPKTLLMANFPYLTKILMGSSFVVSAYAAYAIERFLSMTVDGKLAFTVSDIKDIYASLMKNLFAALTCYGTENEFAMKAIMRLCLTLQEAAIPLMDFIVPRLCEVYNTVSKAPKKPNFSHYLFETFAVIIRILKKTYESNPMLFNSFEGILYPLLLNTIEHDITEFIPYSLQLLAAMLEFHKSGIPPNYMVLLNFLLSNQQYSDATGNIPGLIRLLCVYAKVGARFIFPNEMERFLTLFQKMLASKLNDHEGFKLLQYIMFYSPREYTDRYLKDLFYLMFKRATSSKTLKFVRCFILYISLLVILYTPDKVVELVDGLQNDLFKMVIESLYLNDLKTIVYEEKLAVVGTTKILTESSAFLNGKYSDLWDPLFCATVELIQNRSCSEKYIDEKFSDEKLDEFSIEFSPAYSQLKFCDIGPVDPVPEVTSSKEYFRTSLIDLNKRVQEKKVMLSPCVSERLQMQLQNL